MTEDIGLAGFPLGIKAVELLFQSIFGGFAGVDEIDLGGIAEAVERAKYLFFAKGCILVDSDLARQIANMVALPVKIAITPGRTHDIMAAAEPLADIRQGQMVLDGRTYDADWLHTMAAGAVAGPSSRQSATGANLRASRSGSISSAI